MPHLVSRLPLLLATLATLMAPPVWAGGWLGITVQPPEGVQIGEIVKDGPADKANLKKNDLLTKMDGKPITSISQFFNSMAMVTPDKEIILTIVRLGEEREIKIIPDDSQNHQSLLPSGQPLGHNVRPDERMWSRSEPPWTGNSMPPGMEPGMDDPARFRMQPNTMYNPMSSAPLEPPEPPPTSWLGVAPELTPTGVVLTRIAPGGPGERAGLQVNDIIVSLNGQSISSPRAMSRVLRDFQPGNLIEVTINRNGQMIDVQAQLAAPPVDMP